MPFSSYIPYAGSPCDSVYKSGEDYVFVRHDQQFLEDLRMIVDFEDELESTAQHAQQDDCVESTIRLMCQYYLIHACPPSCSFTPTHRKLPGDHEAVGPWSELRFPRAR